MKVDARVEKITPARAEFLLSLNTNNRRLSEKRATALADAIRRGEWETNGDSIRISEHGVLLDGQHRLRAIVMAGVPVETLVVTGLDSSVFDTIDQGKARTKGEVLALKGVKNANLVASIARKVHVWSVKGDPFNPSLDASPTAKQIELLCEHDQGIHDAAKVVEGKAWLRAHLGPTNAGLFVYAAIGKYRDEMFDFIDSLSTGANLPEGSPVLMLRNRLIEDKATKGKIQARYKTALAFKAFRYYVAGVPIKTLRIREDGKNKEKDLFRL